MSTQHSPEYERALYLAEQTAELLRKLDDIELCLDRLDTAIRERMALEAGRA
jgi:hypothetical protein